MGQPRVIIADDDVLLREGLASLLDRSGMQVLGQAGDAQQFLDLVDQHLPDLVLVDIRMLPTNTTEGLAAARTIRQTHPQVGIVVLSVHVAVELVATRRRDPPGVLSPREREVLGLMAEGRSNAASPGRLWVTEGTVEKHVRAILTKLGLAETDDDHRRVLAVLAYLDRT